MNPNERTLELDKILELLANEAANDLTREHHSASFTSLFLPGSCFIK